MPIYENTNKAPQRPLMVTLERNKSYVWSRIGEDYYVARKVDRTKALISKEEFDARKPPKSGWMNKAGWMKHRSQLRRA